MMMMMMMIMVSQFHQVSQWALSVSQREQYQGPETSSPKWNAAIFNGINYKSIKLCDLFLRWEKSPRQIYRDE